MTDPRRTCRFWSPTPAPVSATPRRAAAPASACRTSGGGSECYYGDRATLTLKRSAAGETVAELTLPMLHAPGQDDEPDEHDAISESIGVGTERQL
jgi:hypothetical protein